MIWHIYIYVYIHITSMRVLFLHFISREFPWPGWQSPCRAAGPDSEAQSECCGPFTWWNRMFISRTGHVRHSCFPLLGDDVFLSWTTSWLLRGVFFWTPGLTNIDFPKLFQGKRDTFSNIWYTAKTKKVLQLYEHVLKSQSNPVPVICVQSNWKGTNYSVLGLFGFGFGGTWLPDPRWNSWFVHVLFIWWCWP